mgnify:CR=1 FL=1
MRSTKARKNVGGGKKRDRLKFNWGRGFFEKTPSPIEKEENCMNILVVDDEKEIADVIELYLKNDQYNVLKFYTGQEALDCIASTKIDLAILDIMLPDVDGFQILKQIREKYTFPVIMLTALGTTEDIVKGLDAGADDYLVKPFSFQELEARIKALLRRNKEVTSNLLTCDNLILDCNTRRAKRGNIDIDLTVKEYRLLEYFMTHQGVALSRITLLKDVWDKNFDTNTNIVDVYVNYLRVKIDRDFDKKLIHTVVGLGYIMNT